MRAFQARDPLHLALSSADWSHIPVDIRIRATFSANVHNARFLSVLHSVISSSLARWARARTRDDYSSVRASFVHALSRVAVEEGMGPLVGSFGGRYEDISSATRLKLVFDTLTRQAYGYASYAWQFRRQDQYPAARFIRHPGAKIKRPLHEANENVVRRFDDVDWWCYMNNREIGGFEVPWSPYGYNSWMDRVPIGRQQAISLGVIQEDTQLTRVKHPGFNDRISTNVEGMPPDLLKQLRRSLKGHVTLSKGNLIFHPHT